MVEYINGRLAHFFPCGAQKCKSPIGGVHRYQDSKDKSFTANLKQHANLCFGKEAVHSGCKGVIPSGPSGTIYAAFGRQNCQPVTHTSLHVHTNDETRQEIHFNVHVHLWQDLHTRAQLVRWITESNRPINIINDHLLRDLLTAGRPSITLPSWTTISRDIHESFKKCQQCIGKLLQVSLSFYSCIPAPDGSFIKPIIFP